MALLPRPPQPQHASRHLGQHDRVGARVRARGVSLVEALVALAVMSIGMLALVGVQSTMRLNSDLAKQRTEATRIASEEIEAVRSYVAMAAVQGTPGVSYDEIVSRTVDGYQPPDGIGNTTYRVVRTVADDTNSTQKVVSVVVQWIDRTNTQQTVTVDGAINAADPTLTALLMVPHRESAFSRNQGRHVSIPQGAVPDGRDPSLSRFTPPGSSSIVWYFNNLTGLMRVCDVAVTDITTCPEATLVSGTVQFQLANRALTGADAEAPPGPVSPFLATGPGALELVSALGAPQLGTGTSASCYSEVVAQWVIYFCAVQTTDSRGWGGQLNPVLSGANFNPLLTGDPGYPGYKSCRYTSKLPAADDPNTAETETDTYAEYAPNAEHPRTYCMERPRNRNETTVTTPCTGKRVKVNLINQNFLVIRGDQSCPTEYDIDNKYVEAGDNLVRANTRPHQPFPPP